MKATSLITGGLIGAATLLASAALAGQAHSDPPGWTYMDYDAVARGAKAAGITADPVGVEVVMGDVCWWLHNDESDTEVARTFASELGHVTPAQTYAVATMAVKYLCPPEKGKLDGYLRRCVCLGPLHEGDRAQRPDLPGRAVANSRGGVTEAVHSEPDPLKLQSGVTCHRDH